jgi:hypothetical protein
MPPTLIVAFPPPSVNPCRMHTIVPVRSLAGNSTTTSLIKKFSSRLPSLLPTYFIIRDGPPGTLLTGLLFLTVVINDLL